MDLATDRPQGHRHRREPRHRPRDRRAARRRGLRPRAVRPRRRHRCEAFADELRSPAAATSSPRPSTSPTRRRSTDFVDTAADGLGGLDVVVSQRLGRRAQGAGPVAVELPGRPAGLRASVRGRGAAPGAVRRRGDRRGGHDLGVRHAAADRAELLRRAQGRGAAARVRPRPLAGAQGDPGQHRLPRPDRLPRRRLGQAARRAGPSSTRASAPASRSAGWAAPRRSPARSRSWPARRRASAPPSTSSSTAASSAGCSSRWRSGRPPGRRPGLRRPVARLRLRAAAAAR